MSWGVENDAGAGRRTRVALVAILALGGLLRFVHLDRPQLWADEILQLVHFSKPTLAENLRVLRELPAVAPLDYLVQGAFVATLGRSEWSARFHAALFGFLTLPLVYFAALKIVVGRRRAMAALIIAATSPLLVAYSREGRNYSLFLFLALLSFILFWRAVERKAAASWLIYGLAMVPLLYANYLALLILPLQALVLILIRVSPDASPPVEGRDLRRFGLAAALALALVLPWLAWTAAGARAEFEEDFLSAGFWLRLVKEFSGGGWPLSLAMAGAFWMGLRRLRREGRHDAFVLLAVWFVVAVSAVVFVDWWRGYFFAARQILFAAPAWILAASAAVAGCGIGGGGARAALGETSTAVDGVDAPVSRRVTRRELRSPTPSGLGEWRHRLREGLRALGQLKRQRGTALLALIVCLNLGSLAFSRGKTPADWKGLAIELERRVAASERIAGPLIGDMIAFRFPGFRRHRIELAELAELLERPTEGTAPTASVYLVKSHLLPADMEAEADAVLRKGDFRLVAELRGFEVYQATQATNQPKGDPTRP